MKKKIIAYVGDTPIKVKALEGYKRLKAKQKVSAGDKVWNYHTKQWDDVEAEEVGYPAHVVGDICITLRH